MKIDYDKDATKIINETQYNFTHELLADDECADLSLDIPSGTEKRHYCLFCEHSNENSKKMTRILRHIRFIHEDQPEVKMAIEAEEAGNRVPFDLLKLKGDHFHNLKVISQQRGRLKVTRTPQAGTPRENCSVNDFLPCAHCKVSVSKRE